MGSLRVRVRVVCVRSAWRTARVIAQQLVKARKVWLCVRSGGVVSGGRRARNGVLSTTQRWRPSRCNELSGPPSGGLRVTDVSRKRACSHDSVPRRLTMKVTAMTLKVMSAYDFDGAGRPVATGIVSDRVFVCCEASTSVLARELAVPPRLGVWDLESGNQLGKWIPDATLERTVAVGEFANHPSVFTLGNGGEVEVWDASSGRVTKRVNVGVDWIFTFTVSQVNGETLAIVSGGDITLRAWNLESGVKIGTVSDQVLGGPVYAVGAGEFGGEAIMAAGRDGAIKLWNLETRESSELRCGTLAYRLKRLVLSETKGNPIAVGAGMVQDEESYDTPYGPDWTYTEVRRWDLENGTTKCARIAANDISGMTVGEVSGSPSVVTVHPSGEICVWGDFAS